MTVILVVIGIYLLGIGITFTVIPPIKNVMFTENIRFYGLWPIAWFCILALACGAHESIWEGIKSEIEELNNHKF